MATYLAHEYAAFLLITCGLELLERRVTTLKLCYRVGHGEGPHGETKIELQVPRELCDALESRDVFYQRLEAEMIRLIETGRAK